MTPCTGHAAESSRTEWDRMMQWLHEQDCEQAALARSQLTILGMTREALSEWTDRANEARDQLAAHREMLFAVGSVLDVVGRGARMEMTAHDLIETAVDTTMFKNLMASMYGLGPCGETLPVRKKRGVK